MNNTDYSDTEQSESAREELVEQSDHEETKIMERAQMSVFNESNGAWRELNSALEGYRNKANENSVKPKSNITIQGKYSGFVPKDAIVKILGKIEQCRIAGCKIPIAEVRYTEISEYSGIMIDLDMKIGMPKLVKKLDERIIDFVKNVMKFLNKYIENGLRGDYMVLIERKPEPVKIEDEKEQKECYKMGYHVIIPEILLTKIHQKYLFEAMREMDLVSKSFDAVKFINASEVFDIASYRVPVYFPGFPSKPDKPSYRLEKFLRISFNESGEMETSIIENYDKDKRFNACGQFCLSLGLTDEFGMKRRQCSLKAEHKAEIEKLTHFNVNNDNKEQLDDLLANDINATNLYAYLNLIGPVYLNMYDSWTKIVWAICNINTNYECLARWISQKDTKFSESGFAEIWRTGCYNKRQGKPGSGIAYIKWLARMSNPAEYEKIRHNNVSHEIITTISKRPFRHADVAKILSYVFEGQYLICADDQTKRPITYQFKTHLNDPGPGEIYKWRQISLPLPQDIMYYMSEDLTNILEKYESYVNEQMKTLAANDEKHKCLKAIIKNIHNTKNSLGNTNFMKSSIEAMIYNKNGMKIIKQSDFDKDKRTFGVGNGILLLERDKLPKLIQEHNNFLVTKTTKYNYIPFDPRNNAKHRRVLIDYRIRYPWNESDTFLWKMMHYGFALTGYTKPTMLVTCTGEGKNGKSEEIETIVELLEDYGCTVPATTFTEEPGKSESASPAGLSMVGKNLIACSETSKQVFLREEVVKSLTGQDRKKYRALFSNTFIQAVINALFFIVSNFPFLIQDTSYSIWRRLVFHTYKVIFMDPENDSKDKQKFDPNNPYHINISEINRTYGPYKRHREDPELMEAVLSMLVYFYTKLVLEYKGDLSKIPKPHIDYETRKFEMEQNSLLKFMINRVVRIVGDEKEETDEKEKLLPVKEIAIAYCDEMKKVRGLNVSADGTTSEIAEMPELKHYIVVDEKTNYKFLRGCALLKTERKFADNEEPIFATNTKELEAEYKSQLESVGVETLDSFLAKTYADVDRINSIAELEKKGMSEKAQEYYNIIREEMDAKLESQKMMVRINRQKKEVKTEIPEIRVKKTSKPKSRTIDPDDL